MTDLPDLSGPGYCACDGYDYYVGACEIHDAQPDDDPPTPTEVVAMHLWKTLPADVPIYTKLPGGTASPGYPTSEEQK
jgi:hypothetical protein